MEDDNPRFAQMSNRSLIREIDEAEAVLDDEIKVILEFEKNGNNNTSVYADESFFEDDDDDDLTGELANLESLTALQRELNMSAISYEEFNATTSRAYALEREEEEEDAVITDVGEIQIGDFIMEEAPCATWKPAPSLSQDSSIRSVSKQSPEQRLRKQTIHRLVSRDGVEEEDIVLTKQPSNDSEGSSVFQTSSHDNSSAMHLMSQDRLDIDIAVSPIRCESEEEAENKDLPASNQESNIKPVFRRILVDTTPTVNAMDYSNESEALTPKIQNTKPVANIVQCRDDDISHIADENRAHLSVSKASKNAPQKKANEAATLSPPVAPKLSPVSSLLNTLLASPEPATSLPDINVSLTVFEAEEEVSVVGVPETSENESSNAGESHSFSSQLSQAMASASSVSPVSSVSTTSASSSASSASTSSAQSKWNPMRLFNQKNSSEDKTRKSMLSKTTSKSKKKKSKSKTRQRFSSPLNLPTVSEDKTLAPTQAPPPNITLSQPHDPSENEIRNTLGMEEGSTSREGRRSSLFQDNKERVAVNRMMKMLMEQRNKNKTQEKRERKLLHMLCDARNDRKQLIDGHEKEAADLHRKFKSSFENNEILRQENELLLMQTDAWKEISRQSNQTAALYKYSFGGRQVSPRYEAPVGETIDGRSMEMAEEDDELVQVKREKEELEDKLRHLQKESHLEMEGLKYQTEFVTQELKESQSLFEDKLQNYIQENMQLMEETNSLRKELELKNVEVSNARDELQDLQKKLNSKLDAEVTNLRAQKLEDQLASMEEDHKAELAHSNRDKAMAEARIQNLTTSLGTADVERQRAEKDLNAMRDQLSHERKSRSQSTLIFQQRNEFLMNENQSLKKEVKNLKAELASTRTDQLQLEAELLKETKEVHRLEKQSEDEAELIKELQEELDSLQTRFTDPASETSSTEKVAKSAQAALSEAQDTLENEIQAAEKIALRVQVERLKLELKSKSPSTPRSSYPSTYKSPVERRVRDQMLRLRKSLTPKEKEEEGVVPPPSPFFTDSTSVTLSGKPKSLKSPTPLKFVSMLRPKAKGPSIQPRRLDKENNTFMSPQKRRGGGLSARTSLGIR